MGVATDPLPLSLIRYQGPMLRAIGRIALDSLLGPALGRRRTNPLTFTPVSAVLAPLPDALIDRYVAWCCVGMPRKAAARTAARYAATLPPHLFSQWAMPLASSLLLQSRYRLAGIINQGVSMTVTGALPRGVPLQVRARLARLEETAGRARLAVALETGLVGEASARIQAELQVTFMLPGKGAATGARGAGAGRRSSEAAKSAAAVATAATVWETAGEWQAADDDGLRFALLTGDFNPIHWLPLAGRLSPFGRRVLHGFGSLVRSYEVLAAADGAVPAAMEVRFLRPVTLPSGLLAVQRSAGIGTERFRELRLWDAATGRGHLVGRYRVGGTRAKAS